MGHSLVLGGSGFIGGHLSASLARDGETVTSVARSFGRRSPPPGVTPRPLDLYACSTSQLRSLTKGADVIYHLAWSTFSATAEQDPASDLTGNVGFFVRLLDCLKSTGARIVFCSSGGTVYGRAHQDPIPEASTLRPLGAYGAGKVAAETYAGVFQRAYGLDVRIARLSNPYGVGQDPDRMQGALTRFAARAIQRSPIEVWGDGSVVRDYLHIDDAVEALKRLGQAPRDTLGPSPTFNIGSGRGASLRDLISLIEGQLGAPLSVTYSSARHIDVPWNVLDVSKIEEKLGWRPNLILQDGVKLLLDDLARLVHPNAN